MAAPVSRRRLAHYAAPVAFLAAVTIAVLLIRSGLGAGGPAATTTLGAGTTTTINVSKSAHRKRHRKKPRAHAQFYVVQSGDTFGTIATREGTSVARLQALNPGVSTNALAVGQKLRVK